jgi:hypothetical protein
MDQGQRRRRRVRARDVLRIIRKFEPTPAEPRTPLNRADEVLVAIADYKASRGGRKIKKPPVD